MAPDYLSLGRTIGSNAIEGSENRRRPKINQMVFTPTSSATIAKSLSSLPPFFHRAAGAELI
jgi:hypothetical protein